MDFSQGIGRQSERVLLTLRRELEQGVYPLHARLPSAAEFCARFNSSRNTILRALERLEAEGYIESRRGAGTFVLKTGRPPAMSRTIAAMFTFDSDNLITVQNHALERGFLLCVYSRNTLGWGPAPERAFLERVRAERHLGLLACLTPTPPVNDDLLRAMAADGIRILHIEPYEMTPPEQNYLIPDYLRGGYLAATTALLRGFKRLVFAGTASDWPSARLFRQGFEDAVAAHVGPVHPAQHYFEFPTGTNVNPAAARKLGKYLAGCEPGTAFVCRSTDMAAEIAKSLAARGWQPGREFLAVGVRYLTEFPGNESVPAIDFDRPAVLKRAVDLLTADDWPRVQDLVTPRLVGPPSDGRQPGVRP